MLRSSLFDTIHPQAEGGLLVKAIEEVVRQRDQSRKAAESSSETKNDSDESSAKPEVETELIGSAIVERLTCPQKRAEAIAAIAEHYIATATVNENEGIQRLAGRAGTRNEYLEFFVPARWRHGCRQDSPAWMPT